MNRTAVVDLGSNSFRLVVYDWQDGGPWTLSDEIREPVRISAGMGDKRELRGDAIERAVSTTQAFASFCASAGIDDVVVAGTSAIRDALNRDDLLELITARARLDVRVLSGAEEAYYGYLAAVNSTTLNSGFTLELGGGSLQLCRVENRLLREAESLPLGAVRVSERFLPEEEPAPEAMNELAEHVATAIGRLGWWRGGGRLVGIGGSVRNLAAAAQKRGGYPDSGVQGFPLTAPMLDDLVEELASRPASKRGKLPGVKPDRGDVILGAAVVLSAALGCGGFDAVEVTEAGLREGIFFERFLAGDGRPLLADVRAQAVENLARRFHAPEEHVRHVAALSLELYDGLAAAGVIETSSDDRELLHAACILHDIGVAIDYDDHHKHSRYLILSAGLPGHTQRELELVSLIARYHRKGDPDPGALRPFGVEGDDRRLRLLAGILRVVEQLERGRDQCVRRVVVRLEAGALRIEADAETDSTVAIWSARRAADALVDAIGKPVEIDRR